MFLFSFSCPELPEIPQNIETTEIESRSLKFKWEEVPGPINFYFLQYREEYSEIWRNSTINGDSQFAEINSLLPATKYIIRLMATNELGSSDPSKPIAIYTLEEGKRSIFLYTNINY